ncbi:uncharacterized protein TNCV_1253291 [Trichonephila clavipes]|nr:uncharacterized protein TNCV_1253291 [Trichonephila clavipes]
MLNLSSDHCWEVRGALSKILLQLVDFVRLKYTCGKHAMNKHFVHHGNHNSLGVMVSGSWWHIVNTSFSVTEDLYSAVQIYPSGVWGGCPGAQKSPNKLNLTETCRALDWFEVLGYRVIEDKTTDYAHLKQALSEQFPVVRNRSELETRFYSSSQRRDQQPSDFIYELLKIHKILKLEMSEEKLIDHVISRLEPQILDYVEVRHPRNTANLLQIVDKYEERFMHRQIRGSSEGFRSSGPHENNRFNTRHRQEN